MKELSIEEKAKRYDEAFGKAKKELDTCGSQDCDAARQIFRFFPELKESEDERIRKELIEFFNQFENGKLRGVDITPWIAWLEKQGEQKPAWSEEDEKMFSQISDILWEGYKNTTGEMPTWDNIREWCLSLKDRCLPQPKQEWSEDTSTHEYIDLGLPSGTLWEPFNEEGYYTYNVAVEKFGDKLPTKEQCEELKNECKWEWKVNGYCVTGPNSKSIFLPAAGYHTGNSVYCVGALGGYWSYNKDGAWSVDFDSDDVDMHPRGIYNHGFSVRLVK